MGPKFLCGGHSVIQSFSHSVIQSFSQSVGTFSVGTFSVGSHNAEPWYRVNAVVLAGDRRNLRQSNVSMAAFREKSQVRRKSFLRNTSKKVRERLDIVGDRTFRAVGRYMEWSARFSCHFTGTVLDVLRVPRDHVFLNRRVRSERVVPSHRRHRSGIDDDAGRGHPCGAARLNPMPLVTTSRMHGWIR